MKSECPDLEARYCCAANVSEAECPEEAGTWTSEGFNINDIISSKIQFS